MCLETVRSIVAENYTTALQHDAQNLYTINVYVNDTNQILSSVELRGVQSDTQGLVYFDKHIAKSDIFQDE